MSKPFPLAILMNLAEHNNESAIRKLGQLNQQQQTAQQQLEMLLEYRRDYLAQMQHGAQQGMSPTEMRNFQQFIFKLDEAIAQQRLHVENSETLTRIGRDEFNATRRKVQSLDTLRQRHVESQQKIAEKTEQKAQDEHTIQSTARRMNAREEQDPPPGNEP